MSDIPVLVTNWKKVVRTVTTSIRVNGERVARKLQADLFPANPEGTELFTVYTARADALERKVEVLSQRALALRAQRGNDEALRLELETAVTELRRQVMRTRSFLDGFFETTLVSQTGLTGLTPTDPDALGSFAAHAAEQLRILPFPELREDEDGVTFNPSRHAEKFEAGVARVKAAKDAQATDDRVEQQAMQARDEAEKELRHAYIAAADGFSADAIQAGYPQIAERVRPTNRRREGNPEPIDLEESDLTEPGIQPEPADPESPDPALVTDPNKDD